MNLNDYRQADCTLYRLPPIDTSKLEKAIEVALVQAWQNNASVDQAINSVVSDTGVLRSVTQQIAENLEFQRTQELQRLEEGSAAELQKYGREQQERQQHLEATLGNVVNEQQSEYQKAQQQAAQQRTSYSAAQQKLEEMRARIKKKLEEVGGQKKLQRLLEIHEKVAGPPAVSSSSPSPSSSFSASPGKPEYSPLPPAQSLDTALTLATAQETVDPLQGKTVDIIAAKAKQKQEAPGALYRFTQGLWKVLNYKLF